MALAFAVIGVYQYATRDVFWNPKVIVGNAYAPFYRVNSVFYDPSVYGRFLVVAILAALVLALYDRNRRGRVRGRRAAIVLIWAGPAVLVLAVELRGADGRDRGRRRRSAGAGARRSRSASSSAVIAAVALGTPHIRHSLLRESGSGLNKASSGRAKLVTQGIRIARAPPGPGRRDRRLQARVRRPRRTCKGKEPKKAASHNTAVTVAAETGHPRACCSSAGSSSRRCS